MSIQVEKLEHNMAKLTVTVSAEEFDKAITKAYNKQKGQISVPGFRKGKVPQAMVEKMYGPQMFYEEAVNFCIPDAYEKAAEESGLEITSQPAIDFVQVNKGQEFIFTAEVAVKPDVTLGSYKGVEVVKTEIVVTDEEVDEAIKADQQKNARVITVEGAAEKDDTVVIDYEGSVDGELFDGGAAEGHELVLGSNSFIPGFEDQLIGTKAGDDVEVSVTFPEEYHAEELAGKAAIFKVKVNEVKRTELPELNDEFAQDVSECDTFEEYKAEARKTVTEKKEKEALSEKQQKVMDKVVENAVIDIPDAMVTTQARQMLNQQAQQLQQYGLSLEQYCQFSGLTPEDLLEQQIKPMALKNIQNRLVLEAVAAAEGFEASEGEVEDELKKLSETSGMPLEQVKEYIGEFERKSIVSDIVADKALKVVTDAAVEVEGPAEETTEDAE